MRSLPLLIFVKLLVIANYAMAAAEPYGKFFVELEAHWDDEAMPGPPKALGAPLKTEGAAGLADAISERLIQQEYQNGPYAVTLAETLDELARAQEAAGAPELARRSRERALHLIRINEGLYSSAQRPILRAILEALRRDGDFVALDERYDYFFRLYGSGQPPWDTLRWSAVMEYLRWQREALRRDLDGDPRKRLLRLQGLHEELRDALELQASTVDFRKLADATYSQLKSLYLMEALIKPRAVFQERQNAFIVSRDSRDPRDFNLEQERLESLHRMLRGTGRALIEGLLKAIPPEEPSYRAKALLALGDWLQWHGSTRQARNVYEQLWRELQRNDLAELSRRWFSRPVPLPDNGVFYPSGREAGGDALTVSLSVSESGKASAKSVDVPEDLKRAAGRLRRYLGATRFRPVVENGRVSAASDLTASYWLFKP